MSIIHEILTLNTLNHENLNNIIYSDTYSRYGALMY